MKQPSIIRQLGALSSDLHISIPADRLADMIAWLTPAAHRLGLTNYANAEELCEGLVVPALYVLSPPLLPHLHSPTLDFGAGSGAVGLSLAVAAPHIQVVLADRRRRVVEFLDLAIRRYNLPNCDTLLVDLSNPPKEWQATCGTVLIRAFGPTKTAISQAQRWLRGDGTLALWHRPPPPAPHDGSVLVRTEATNLPSLCLSIYQTL